MILPRILRALLLGLVMAGALALRLSGNTVGLPGNYVPDEESKVRTVLTLPDHGFAHWESQPSLMYYTLFIVYKAVDPWRGRIAAHPALEGCFEGPEGDSAWYRWVGRCLMAVLGAATCLPLYRLGKSLHGRAAGLIGASIWAAAPLAVALTHYLKEDTPLALMTTIVLWRCVRAVSRPRRHDVIVLGILAGVGFAAKYPGAFLLLPVGMVLWMRHRDDLRSAGGWPAALRVYARRCAPALVPFIVTFFVICPTYLNLPRLLGGLQFQSEYMVTGHQDGVSAQTWNHWFTFYLRKDLAPGVGWPAVLAGVAGMVMLWRVDRRRAAIPLLWTAGYFLLAELLPSKPYPFHGRYIIPMVPPLCAFAGVFASRLPRLFGDAVEPAMRSALVATIAMVLVVTPLIYTAKFLVDARPDTRDVARAWIRASLPPDSVLLIPQPRYSVVLGPDEFIQRRLHRKSWHLRKTLHQLEGHPVFAVVSSMDYDRYLENPGSSEDQLAMWEEVLTQQELVAVFSPRFPSYGYHNPTVRVYLLKASTKEEMDLAFDVLAGKKKDPRPTQDVFAPLPPFPARLDGL